ncbi:hypothetical protein [Methylorubrum thiocyanatum]|uniref:Uncharacterized protein n=1 Tax=Methylorubrum thiocyanatum TaxID=47958 RepID=A0AA40S3Y2_9HYPH|nr:hypothetical protein [Methylorubrum thiocyanatum]MBA8914123.1 hypothetical protein [Methylorubrum thiocyanatum]GJE79088.1 hypothetical protein CJNNKLLH_0413 [Methylorubrum thiocyanatum]
MTRTLATLILSGSLAFAAATMVQARPMTMPGASDTGFEVVDASASRAIPVLRDNDGANAKNPALPSYERGRGQETGGPARQLIGN